MLNLNDEQKRGLRLKLSPYLFLIKRYKLKFDSICVMEYCNRVVIEFFSFKNPKLKGLYTHEFDKSDFKNLKIERYLSYNLKDLLEDN